MIINIIKFTITMIIILTTMSFISTILSRHKQRKIANIKISTSAKPKKKKISTSNSTPVQNRITVPNDDDDLSEEDAHISYSAFKDNDDDDGNNEYDKTVFVNDMRVKRADENSSIKQYNTTMNGNSFPNPNISVQQNLYGNYCAYKNNTGTDFQNMQYMNPIIPVQNNIPQSQPYKNAPGMADMPDMPDISDKYKNDVNNSKKKYYF